MSNLDQIVAGLHQGCSAVKADRLVLAQAGDILTLINGLRAEQQRADKAETLLAAPAVPQPSPTHVLAPAGDE